MMLQTRSALLKRAAFSRQIRSHLGDGLRAYYNAMQQVPLPDRLADRIKQLAQLIDEVKSEIAIRALRFVGER